MKRHEDNSEFSTGVLIISLDFELYWGVRDKRALVSYAENLRQTREAVTAMLSLFAEFGIHATWSTVGFLFLRSRDELLENIPETLPGYHDQNLCPYSYLQSTAQFDPEVHLAPQLIRSIAQTPGQEVGTHTFSHFYCLEEGVTVESFLADLRKTKEVGEHNGLPPASLVFPRNQWRPDVLRHLPGLGIRCFRGVENHPIYEATPNSEQGFKRRGLRFLDSYLNLTGHHIFGPGRCGTADPFDLPASRFLRPYNQRLRLLEPLRKRRIVNSMRHAAKTRQAFHLWWHPHNFGKHLRENLDVLRSLLEEYRRLHNEHGFRSLSMVELAGEL